MNRGFAKYYKEGRKKSRKTFKIFQLGNILKFGMCQFMILLSGFISPIAASISIKRTKGIYSNQEIDVFDSASGINDAKRFWKVLGIVVLEIMYILAGILVIACFTGVLLLIGVGIGENVYSGDGTSVIVYMAIPGVLALLIFLYVMRLYFAPCLYIAENYPELGASEVLSLSRRVMKKTGKRTVFLFDLFQTITYAIYAAIVGITLYCLFERTIPSIGYTLGWISMGLFVLILLWIYPRIYSSKHVGLYALFHDTVSDEGQMKRLSGFTIETIKYYEKKKNKKKINKKPDEALKQFFKSEVEKEELKVESIEVEPSGTEVVEAEYEPTQRYKEVYEEVPTEFETVQDVYEEIESIDPEELEDDLYEPEDEVFVETEEVVEEVDPEVEEALNTYEEETTEEEVVFEEPVETEEVVVEEEVIEETEEVVEEVDEFDAYIENLVSKEGTEESKKKEGE